MNRSDLIELLSKKEDLTEKMATDVIDLIFDGFADELKKGGRIRSGVLEVSSSGNTKPMSDVTRKRGSS